jgi:hypothetical protein
MAEPERSNHIISPNGPSSLSTAGWPGMNARPPFLCGLKGCDTQLDHQTIRLPARHLIFGSSRHESEARNETSQTTRKSCPDGAMNEANESTCGPTCGRKPHTPLRQGRELVGGWQGTESRALRSAGVGSLDSLNANLLEFHVSACFPVIL